MPSHYFHHIAIDKHGNRLTFIAGVSGDYKEIINLASNSPFRLIDPKTCIQNMHHSDVKYIYDHYLFKNLLARELGSDAEDSLYKALCQDKIRLVSIEYQAAQKEASAELRLAIKQTLTNIVLQTSAQAKIEQEVFGQESTISKGLIYVGAFMQGIGSSVWGLATWVKEVSDVVNPVVIAYNSFKAATASYGNDNQFSDELLKLQYRELVQALGFDPSQISQEQLKTAFETLEVVWADNDLKKRLTVFCKEYAQAQHSITITNVAGSAVFEIALAVIILAATGGAGLMPAFASKGHLIRSFNKLGDLLLKFVKKRKKDKRKHFNKNAKTGSAHTSHSPDYQPVSDLTAREGNRVHKRVHPDGKQPSPTDKYGGDPYTLQADGKPLGAKAGVMPNEHMGLKKLTPEQERLIDIDKYPDIRKKEDFANFSSLEPHTLKPGDTVYRIIDEQAGPAGGYWASELPANKTEWRSQYAVKDSWNDNGYYVKYTVPEGQEEIQVWKGKTAGQQYKEHNGKDFYLEGGNEQIYMTPGTLDKQPLTPQLTNWPEI